MMSSLLVFLILSLLLRYGLPLLLRWVVGRVVRQATGSAFGGARPGDQRGERTASPRPAPAADGRVRVAYVPPRPKRAPRPGGYVGGEYVEFEDVR